MGISLLIQCTRSVAGRHQ